MSDEWQIVYYAANPIEAQLLKGMLASENINVSMNENSMIGGVGELPADAIETALKVPSQQYTEARKLLDNYENSEQEAIYCPQCKEQNFSNFEVCWNCGKALF